MEFLALIDDNADGHVESDENWHNDNKYESIRKGVGRKGKAERG